MKKYEMNLQLFNEGGDGGEGSVADSNSGTDVEVVYGKQEEPIEESTEDGQVAPEDKPAEKVPFDELIKGDYKEDYEARIKKTLDRRLKNSNKQAQELQAYAEATEEALAPLYLKYGLDVGDIQGLQYAIQGDNTLIEAEAEKLGLTPDQYRYQLELEQQANMAHVQQERMEAQRQAQEQYSKWMAEAEEFQKVFPDFDLEEESSNPEFVGLLQAGVSVKAAFNAIHADEIMEGVIANTAQSVRETTTNNIRSRGNRPAENGARSNAGVVVKSDPTKLTAEDRAEIARKVQRGETITF